MKKFLLAVMAGLSFGAFAASDIPDWAESSINTTYLRYLDWKGEDETVVIPTITDIHDFVTESATPLNFANSACHLRILKRAGEVFGADMTANLGDLGIDYETVNGSTVASSADHQAKRLQAEADLIGDFTRPHIEILGNHDHGAGTNRFPSQAFGELLNPRSTKRNPVERTRGFSFGANNTYGFYDIEAKSTRIIFLNTTDYDYTTGYAFSDEQLQYLKDRLAELGTGMFPTNVAVFTHYCLNQELGCWVSDWESRGGKPIEGNLVKAREAIEAFAQREGVKVLGVFCGDSHFSNHIEENGVKWAISQGFGGVGAADIPSEPAKGVSLGWVDRARETLLDVAAFKPATGEFRVFRIGKGGETSDIKFTSDGPEKPVVTLSAKAYVQKGLVGFLDGIENAGWGTHDEKATSWKDLVGGIGDFEINTSCGEFGARGLWKAYGSNKDDMLGGLLAKCSSRPTASDRPNDIATVEAAMSSMNGCSGYMMPLYMGQGQYMTFQNTGGNRTMFFDCDKSVATGWVTSELVDAMTCSVTYAPLSRSTGFYVNAAKPSGSAASDTYYDESKTPCAIKLGGRELITYNGAEYSCCGYTINAMRFYNRELTEDEVKLNYLIDAYRFRKEIPFATADYKADSTGRQLLCRVSISGVDGVKATVNGNDATGEMWLKVGTELELKAVPNGSRFAAWTGDTDILGEAGEDSDEVTVVVDRAFTLVANGAAGMVRLSAKAYVQNGLVGFLDGIENAGWGKHDETVTSWTDLVGGIGDFEVNAKCGAFQATGLKKVAASKQDDGFYGLLAKCTSRPAVTDRPGDIATIEAAVTGANNQYAIGGYLIPVFMGGAQFMAFYTTAPGTSKIVFDSVGGGNALDTTELPDVFTCAVTYEPQVKRKNYFFNAGKLAGAVTSDNYGDNVGDACAIKLGGRELNYPSREHGCYGFTLNSIRFYNRELTEEEIRQNYVVDAYRYRGEIPFATANYKADETGKKLMCRVAVDGNKGVMATVNGETVTGELWVGLGSELTIKAVMAAGAKFSGWTGDTDILGDTDPASEEVTVIVDRAFTLSANGAEGFGSLSTKAYVQDGLIGLLDGISNVGYGLHDEKATSWKDLVGEIGDFDINTACGAFQEKGLKKVAASSKDDAMRGLLAKCTSRPTAADRPKNVATIEAAITGANDPKTTGGYLMPIFMGSSQYIVLFTKSDGNRDMFFDSNKPDNGWRTTDLVDALTCSVTYVPLGQKIDFFINGGKPSGATLSDNYGDAVPDPCAIKLGGRELNYGGAEHSCHNYTINSIRFYSRELKEDEIRQNYVIDAYRFRGEIPFATANYKADETGKKLLCRVAAKGVAGVTASVVGSDGATELWTNIGGVVTLKATMADGVKFAGWTGDVDAIIEGTDKSDTITVYADRALALTASGESLGFLIEQDTEIESDLRCRGVIFKGAYAVRAKNGAKLIIDEGGTGITFADGVSGTARIDCPVVFGEAGAKQAIEVSAGSALVISGAIGGNAALDLSGDVQLLGGGDAKGDWNVLSGGLTLSGVFGDTIGKISATPDAPLTLVGADVSKLLVLTGENKQIPARTVAGEDGQTANFLRTGYRDVSAQWMSWYFEIGDGTELTIEGAMGAAGGNSRSYQAFTGEGKLKVNVESIGLYSPSFYCGCTEFVKPVADVSAMRNAGHGKDRLMIADCANAFGQTSWELKGKLDLGGRDQTMGRFAYPCEYNADGSLATFLSLTAKVHSDEPATLTVAFDDKTGRDGNKGKGVFGGQFTGKASFVRTGDQETVQELGLAGESTSTGSLTVDEGLVEFVKDLAFGGETYTGSWRTCTEATVRDGGVLALDHSEALGASTRLAVENGGKVRLAAGVRQVVGALSLPTGDAKPGTYGSPDSSADNKLDCFEGEGVIEVAASRGMTILMK